jgi:hypothetical protein
VSPSRDARVRPGVACCNLALALVASLLSLSATTASATDYEFNPRLELAGGYDDNASLAANGSSKIGASDAMADARVDLVARESNWQWRLTPEARGTWYPSHSDLDSNGEFLYLNGLRQGARYSLGLDGYGSSQTLLPTYLPTAYLGTGLGVPEPGTTLLAPASIRQNLGYLSPSYTLQMTERRSLELNVSYTDASYNHQLPHSYEDYQNFTGSAGLLLRATPTGTLTLRATATDFHPQFSYSAQTYGAEAQWDGKFSPTKEYYLRGGAVHSDFSGSVAGEPRGSGSTNWTGGAGTRWTYPLTEIFLDAVRSIAPTGQGYAVHQDQLRLRLAQRLTPRLAAFLGLRTIYQEPLPGSVGPNVHSQHYYYATTGFEWRVEREFSVIGAYEFTDYYYGGPSSSTGRANSVRVSIVYEPHRPAEGPAITVGY